MLTPTVIGRSLLVLLLGYFTYQLIAEPRPWIFIDYLNLIIHEAGHWVFFPFGQFVSILGGSLLQTLVPCLFLVYFLLKEDLFAVAVMVFWVADNIVNVSVYMADANLMQLPLLGGDGVIHDWNWLFDRMGLLSWAEGIGGGFGMFGLFLAIFSIVAMGVLTFSASERG